MSELKAVKQSDVMWGHWFTEYYLKSEADKVIADKDEEITQLQAMLEERNKQVGELKEQDARELIVNNHYWPNEENLRVYLKSDADKVIVRNKYKRCLAMASTCRLRARWFGDNAFYKKEQWSLQWHRRWLEIAEKFKAEEV